MDESKKIRHCCKGKIQGTLLEANPKISKAKLAKGWFHGIQTLTTITMVI